MKITEFTLQKRTFFYVLSVLVLIGGYLSYKNLGRLEFPEFTIKTAVVMTAYPGASSIEVEEEVTDLIETRIQQLSQIKEIRSMSQAGLSIIFVDIKDSFTNDEMPQIWDELRRKVSDVQTQLPAGAYPSIVNDDFGDEYGIFFAVYGDGYTYQELKDYYDLLQQELLLVDDVASVEIWGDQQEIIYMEVSRARMANLGISFMDIVNTLNKQNQIVDAGKVIIGDNRVRIEPSGSFNSVKDVESLLIRSDGNGNVIYLKDVATITKQYQDPVNWEMRFNGKPAIGMGISTASGGNVVTMGQAVQDKIEELKVLAPVGIELGIIAFQSETVTESVDDFIVNLIQAIAIVFVVLCLSMGLASGTLMGVILLMTIMATFIVMKALGINLHLISLGALILALGMLVDNAIVIIDGMIVKTRMGMDKTKAAIQTVSQTAVPLLAATFVAVLAFAAIGTSSDSTGEFLGSLFMVMAISLGLSWVFAITLTALFGVQFMPKPKDDGDTDPFKGWFYRLYRQFLNFCLHNRLKVVALLIFILVVAVYGFGLVEESFFPNSKRPQFMIDYWRPEGAKIEEVSKDLAMLEDFLMANEGVEATTAFIGQGALRFLLTYEPEMPNSSYGQVLITVKDYREIDDMITLTQKYLTDEFPDAETKVKKFEIGPSGGSKIEVRFSGPDPLTLRLLSSNVQEIMSENSNAINIRDDWRQKVQVVRPVISDAQARRYGITRADAADAIAAVYSGKTIGVYREENRQIPIIARSPEDERQDIGSIKDIQIISPVSGGSLNLQQIVTGVNTEWEDPVIRRLNRERTLTVQCDQMTGNASVLRGLIKDEIEAIDIPHGYTMEWGGEFEASADAQESLFKMIPVFLLLMVLTVLGLFNGIRQTVIIFLCLPLAIIGVAGGLLITGEPFGFMCLLGFIGLSGMLIKNAVVLIDQINLEIALGTNPHTAILNSSVSRLRPVVMAALTTVLGMFPLLTDVFYVGMSVTIMSGLTFGTILTLIVVPVLYSMFFRVECIDD